jgi:hypothetical protein
MNVEAERARGHGSRTTPVWLARALVVALVTGAPLVLAPAARAGCSITQLGCVLQDPPASGSGNHVGDVLDGVGGTAGGVVDGATDAVGDAVDDVGGTVGGVVDDVGDTVGDVVDDVGDTVGDVVDDVTDVGGGVVDPTGPGGGLPVAPPSGPTDPATEPALPTRAPANPARVDRSAPASAPSAVPAAANPGAPGLSLLDRPDDESIARRQSHEHGGSLARIAAEAARQLAFPLALVVIVVCFLLVQDRLDRKDPKLALAPMRPEVARFD